MRERSPPVVREPPARLVWDLPLRVFHWSLAVAIAGCWVSYELGIEYFTWHVWSGYAVLVLVVFRVFWGFLGPRYARFASFVRGPAACREHARSLFSREPAHYAGHSPLGALMILLLLAMSLAMGVTGLFANDEIMNTGPLYGHVDDSTSDSLSRLHRGLMDWLWLAIGLHVLVVLAYLLLKHEDLVTPMFTGRRRIPGLRSEDEIAGSRVLLAIALAALAAVALCFIVATAPAPSMYLF